MVTEIALHLAGILLHGGLEPVGGLAGSAGLNGADGLGNFRLRRVPNLAGQRFKRLANDGIAFISAHAYGVQAAGIAGVDGLPHGFGIIAVSLGQYGQVAVQAGGRAGL